MTEAHCLCEQCKMTVMQCKERSAKESSEAVLDDFDLINILKKRYRNEMVVVDALELAEDEVLAVQREQKER